MVFDTLLFQSDPKVNTCITCLRTDFLTNWLTDYQKKINKWITKWINVSSMPFWFVTENEEIKGKRRFLKTSKLQSPNQGSHDGVPFIVTRKRVYDSHQSTERHAADKERRKNAKVTHMIVTFEDMFILEPIEASFLWPLPALRRKSKWLKK